MKDKTVATQRCKIWELQKIDFFFGVWEDLRFTDLLRELDILDCISGLISTWGNTTPTKAALCDVSVQGLF